MPGMSTPGFDMNFTKLLADMKLPSMLDLEPFIAASRRNMEAMTAANRIALEGAQTVARRHMEIMQQAMAEMSDAIKALASPEPPQTKAARQAELLKQGYEHAVANLRELGDLIQRSNKEAMDLLNHRFTEAMNEVKALAEKGK
ncbi:MAG: phasin family protein [Rhodospirillales bacterium]|nr:phasin family protein [Rhodospirillales bacterium]